MEEKTPNPESYKNCWFCHGDLQNCPYHSKEHPEGLPAHTTEKISSNKENGSTGPQEPSTNLEGIRSKLIVGEPQENWKKLADLPVLLEVDKWAAQGRTEEQIYGVTNFLTGLGGKNILALLSKREQTTTPESQGDHESYKSQYLAFMEEFQTTGISRLELERIANYWFTLLKKGGVE